MSTVAQKVESQEWHFVSRSKELLVYLTPDRRIHHPDGTSEVVRGETVQFVPFPQPDGSVLGFYRCEDPDQAERLRKHSGMALGTFEETEVFVPAPPPDGDLAKVLALVAERDAEALVELYADERANWDRPVVLTAIANALRALEAEGVELDTMPQEPHASDADGLGGPEGPQTPGVIAGPPPVDPSIEIDDTVAAGLEGAQAQGATKAFYGPQE